MTCLHYLCLLATYCVVFFFFLRLVYPMLPVSLDCPCSIALSVSSNVYRSKFDVFVHTVSSVLITQTEVPLRFNCQHIVLLLTKPYID